MREVIMAGYFREVNMRYQPFLILAPGRIMSIYEQGGFSHSWQPLNGGPRQISLSIADVIFAIKSDPVAISKVLRPRNNSGKPLDQISVGGDQEALIKLVSGSDGYFEEFIRALEGKTQGP